MADQRPWWKLWISALTDPHLEALSLEDWARWARLGVYIKMHGTSGIIRVPFDGDALRTLLNVSPKLGGERGWLSLLTCLRRLPGLTIEVVDSTPSRPRLDLNSTQTRPQLDPKVESNSATISSASAHRDAGRVDSEIGAQGAVRFLLITFKNWKRYQEDSSAERTRQWRRKRRLGDAVSPSHSDAYSPSHNGLRDGHQPSHGDDVEVDVEVESPLTPLSTSSTTPTPTAWPVDRNGMRLAFHEVYPEAVHRDCPEPRFRTSGQCIDPRYLRAHPDVTGYPTRDAQGTPMQCPYHRQLASSLPW